MSSASGGLGRCFPLLTSIRLTIFVFDVPFLPLFKNMVDEYGTHKVLQQGLSALGCMEHRGACGGGMSSKDGLIFPLQFLTITLTLAAINRSINVTCFLIANKSIV